MDMNYRFERERKAAGVCIKCEGTPVVAQGRCQSCYEPLRVADRKRVRESLQLVSRQIWNPEKQVFVSIDDREAYDAVRAKIAQEMDAGARVGATCMKYKLSGGRLRKICLEHGVAPKWKRGSGEHVKTPERVALETAVLADARSGMEMPDLRKKYPGHDPLYICRKANVIVTPEPVPVQPKEGTCENAAVPTSPSASSQP